MALRGTLKDFGIADIFQLLGIQGKTGTLTVSNRTEKVVIYFGAGNVLRSETTNRQRQDLLGNMLRRAEAITEQQLASALEVQQRTKQRLGDIFIESSAVTEAELHNFTRLQTTETVHRLFLWEDGNYAFEQTEVPAVAGHAPLRSEMLLMEGFRQVDEWPAIRRKLTSYAMSFRVLVDLEKVLSARLQQSSELDLDAVFSDSGDAHGRGSNSDPRLRYIEERERLVYGLIKPGRDVQKLIDLSRLGEFETCKALATLIDAGFVAALQPAVQQPPSAEATVGGISAPRAGSRLPLGVLLRVGATLAVLLAGFTLYHTGRVSFAFLNSHNAAEYVDLSLEDELGRGQIEAIHRALAVYQAEHGAYPEHLQKLVDAGLLPPRGVGFPWEQPYYYARGDRAYTLLRPLY